jgi:hypothetical protein
MAVDAFFRSCSQSVQIRIVAMTTKDMRERCFYASSSRKFQMWSVTILPIADDPALWDE